MKLDEEDHKVVDDELPDEVKDESSDIFDRELELVSEVSSYMKPTLLEYAKKTDMLTRHVRGHKSKTPVEVAELLEDAITWREKNNIDQIVFRDIEGSKRFHTVWNARVHGHDRWGHAVFVERLSSIDFESLLNEFDIHQVNMHRAQLLEATSMHKQTQARRLGWNLNKNVIVVDFEGLSWAHLSIRICSLMREFAAFGNKYYVNTIYRIYVTRTPAVFQFAWKIFQTWVDQGVIDKVRFPENEEATMNELLAIGVPLKSLPDWLGGESPGENITDMILRARKENAHLKKETGSEKDACIYWEDSEPLREHPRGVFGGKWLYYIILQVIRVLRFIIMMALKTVFALVVLLVIVYVMRMRIDFEIITE